MNNLNFNYGSTSYSSSNVRTFMNNVFAFMGAGLALTGVLAYWFGNNEGLMRNLVNESGMTTLGWIVTFAPLAFVLVMSFGINKISYPVLLIEPSPVVTAVTARACIILALKYKIAVQTDLSIHSSNLLFLLIWTRKADRVIRFQVPSANF